MAKALRSPVPFKSREAGGAESSGYTKLGRQVLSLAAVSTCGSSRIALSSEEPEDLGLWVRLVRED